MNKTIRIAGFGGQGVMLLGQLIAHASMNKGYQSTFVPTYGPETRGGTANCMVCISDEEIFSPVFDQSMDFICFNEPSYLKFYDKTKNLILYNATLVKTKNNDERHIGIEATLLAKEIDDRSLNMVMLGAYLKKTNLLNLEDVINSLAYFFKDSKKHLIEQNINAIKAGYQAL
ncbi:2-oxoglutarate ferredoxin oxidoreductase, gamma subunit [Paracholeplasma brassicae]|uniref:2-oxoglutarate ferredoxin oxidoreductase, gamma subunit n=1 Tax=Acholeplasma brassicae TaxID=61635 RepID=U4KNJ9_9MOLU|nr:2-oxoacid:acceptor oxidoreductase family protein [Paracholeplasma brassicae]CCV65846.1 2-oxoglutarate ferredoxin oxidoreductase, gamma subunit [Paracholeplasma brassicae]